MNKPKDDFEEILSQLKVRFKDATRSEKIQILTILPKSWSIRQIEQKFNVTHWMDQTAIIIKESAGGERSNGLSKPQAWEKVKW